MNTNTLTRKPSFVLISAERDNLQCHENDARTNQLNELLTNNGFAFKKVNGVYKGASEVSFYVHLTSENNIPELTLLKETGKFFGQESILIVNNDREARLHFLLTGSEISLGEFKQVNKYIAENSENYTHDFENNGYYVCLEKPIL